MTCHHCGSSDKKIKMGLGYKGAYGWDEKRTLYLCVDCDSPDRRAALKHAGVPCTSCPQCLQRKAAQQP
jgi:hypothetical protein